MVAGAVVLLVVLSALAAPLFAKYVAHTNPFMSNINGHTMVGGVSVPVMQQSSEGLGLGVTPLGPTWDLGHYFLGADGQGRDVMARLLYGGRDSLLIGITSALICCALAVVLGATAGYLGGAVDGVLSRLFDVVWAFPVYLLAICLSVVLLTHGLVVGPVHIGAGSLLVPIFIIAVVYVPYVGRALRAQVISLRRQEFIQAGIATGAGDLRILARDVLPNILPTVIVFVPLMTALNMLIESALSFLSVGVQPPNASWGTIINDGLALLYTRPAVTLAPGLMIALTAGALNVLGDGVRDALDPNARLRGSI